MASLFEIVLGKYENVTGDLLWTIPAVRTFVGFVFKTFPGTSIWKAEAGFIYGKF